NPYWLGLEGWQNIYNKFKKRPDIVKLDIFERDKAFIKWANENIISVMDDHMFLKYALDAEWVAKHQLAVVEPWKDYFGDPPAPNPMDQERNCPYENKSRDADEVIDFIIGQVKGFQYQFPKAFLTDINDTATGRVTLELSDEVGKRVALNRTSLVQTLWVLSQ